MESIDLVVVAAVVVQPEVATINVLLSSVELQSSRFTRRLQLHKIAGPRETECSVDPSVLKGPEGNRGA